MKLDATDTRVAHIKDVLKMRDGDEIFVGVENGPLYVCELKTSDIPCGLEFKPIREIEQKIPREITLAVAYSRPAIAQRILFESACFGVKNLIFYPASKGESDYAKSGLYSSGAWKDWLIKGAEQACATSIPTFYMEESLVGAMKKAEEISSPSAGKFAPDPYEATCRLVEKSGTCKDGIILVLGSERGFSNSDRNELRKSGYELASLSNRILRTDTAVIVSVSAFMM